MALRTYVSSGVYDTHLGSSSITSSNTALTLAGITSGGVTAPNLVNAITGAWICVAAAPTNGGNSTVEIMESGVSKRTATINSADIQLGMNYVRFATSYTFATLTASAYTCRVKNSVGTSGSLRNAASGLWFQFTYDTASAYGASDDIWVGGFNDAGLTAKNLVLSGTTTFGSKATTAIGSTTQTMGAAVTCGSGGTFSYDQTASVNFTIKGSFWCTAGGVIDLRPPSGDKTIIHTTIIDSTANGDQGIFSATGATGGQILTTGATYTQYAKYASGTGTAADPLTFQSAHGLSVGDEIVVPGLAYNTNQVRFVITVVNTTQVVVSTTSGGGESAITNTPAVGSHIANLTRNSIIKPAATNLGYYINNSSNTAGNFDYTRFEHSDNNSGKTLNFSGGSTGGAVSSFDGIVGYNTSNTSGRHWLAMPNTGDPATAVATHTGITAYNTAGTNYLGQSGVGLQGTSNKTVNSILHYNGASTTTGAMLSVNSTSNSNTFNDCHSYGTNGLNGPTGYGIGIFASSANTFNRCTVNSSRSNGVYLSTGVDNVFNDCNFGTVGTNTIDVFCVSSTLNQAVFNNCSFGSATLISNYLNQLDTSEIRFHALNTTAHKHYWYTNEGWGEAVGASLSDTTVKTAGSYNVKLNPENNVTGFRWILNVKATVDQIAFLKGYLRKNATMGTSVAKVELFLPGTLLTDTPDAIFTASNTTGTYQDFVIGKAYAGSENTEAKVRVTAISNTAGAAIYLANFYDSTEALDSWFEGKPSNLVVPTDFSSVPGLIWSYPDSGTTAGTMGKHQADLKLTNVLVKDGLS